jgi:hypothetical protein
LAERSNATDPASREAYARGKTEFIERAIAAALDRGYPVGLPRRSRGAGGSTP